MTTTTLKHCALSYLNQWYTTDRNFIAELTYENDIIKRANSFNRLASKYMIARNFGITTLQTDKLNASQKKECIELRNKLWVKIASALADRTESKQDLTIKEVDSIAISLGKVCISNEKLKIGGSDNNLISAATKLLWFSGFHNIRIYDKRAVIALNGIRSKSMRRGFKVNGSYKTFSEEWNKQFASYDDEITTIVEALKNQLDWSMIPPNDHNIAWAAIDSLWFKERVFDKYLWTLGSSEGATSFI